MDTIKTQLILGILILALCASFVSAVDLTTDKVKLNVDYNNFNKEDMKSISVATDAFTITNADSTPVSLTITATGLPAGYIAESKTITVPSGNASTPGSISTSLNINVTQLKDSGEESIGSIVVLQGATPADSAGLVQETKSMLDLTRVSVRYTDDKDNAQDDTFDDKDEEFTLDNNVLAGTEVEVTFRIENLFDKDYDSDFSLLEEVILTINPSDDDLFADNFDEEYTLDDLDANQKQELTVVFKTNDEADAGDYQLELTLEGQDGKNLEHKIEKVLNLDVKRKRDDIRITKVEVPSSITTCDSSFSLNYEMKNFGTRDQSNVGYSVYNEKLGINENKMDIKLDKYNDADNSWRKNFVFNLPEKITPGTYILEVNAYYDRDNIIDTKLVNAVIKACAIDDTATVPEQNQSGPSSVITTVLNTNTQPLNTTTPNQPVSSSTVIRTVENPYTAEDFVFGGVIALMVLLLALIALFIAVLLKK